MDEREVVDGVVVYEGKGRNIGVDVEGHSGVDWEFVRDGVEDSEESAELQYVVAHVVCGFERVVALEGGAVQAEGDDGEDGGSVE
jgi:hypothetical protein